MATSKRACLIYVMATAGLRAVARVRLEAEGYEVCEVLADEDAALAAQAGDPKLPDDLKACIESAELCVFLLPADAANDGCLGAGGNFASQLGKPFIAAVDGAREVLPQAFDADAAGVVRDFGEALTDALRGDQKFKDVGGASTREVKIKVIKCQ